MARNPSNLQSEAGGHEHTRTSFEIDSQSRSSSFNDSMASQQSVYQHLSGSKFQSSNALSFPGAYTPATSLSNNSSQERTMIDGYPTAMCIDGETSAQGTTPALTTRPPYRTSNTDPSCNIHTNAPKRMVNGEIKSPKGSLPTSPTDSRLYAHSRNSSTTSRSSQIGELSAQLRTRLSYAMVKVQHGWQGHSISELEQMTSQQGSPISATSGTGSDDIRFAQSPGRSTPKQNNHHLLTNPNLEIPNLSNWQQAPSEPPGSTTSSQAGTYEAFWREHSSSATSRLPLTQSNLPSGPTLAPPVDILQRNRHAESGNRQPPPLRTNGLVQLRANIAPSTPQRRPGTGIRTPSQQAAVEKDAVESLLFMSSPGNSGYYPPNNPLTATSPRTTGLPGNGTPRSDRDRFHPRADGNNAVESMKATGSARPLSDHDIDKLLDEMPDDSSDDDDDEDDKMLQQRNLGRVR